MCWVASTFELQMETGAVTLRSNPTRTDCGSHRSPKGGSHEQSTDGGGARASRAHGTSPAAGQRGGDGDRSLALEAGLLPALGWSRAAPAEHAGRPGARAGGGRGISGLSAACGLRSVWLRLRAGVVAAGAAGADDRSPRVGWSAPRSSFEAARRIGMRRSSSAARSAHNGAPRSRKSMSARSSASRAARRSPRRRRTWPSVIKARPSSIGISSWWQRATASSASARAVSRSPRAAASRLRLRATFASAQRRFELLGRGGQRASRPAS
jgi:hypothetical protein